MSALEDRLSEPTRIRLFFSLLTGAVVFVLVAIDQQRLFEPDTFWHVKVGLDIVETWHLPHTDIYSHTHFGDPWIAKEWLSQVLLALAYRAGGWSGVVVSACFSLALTAALMCWFLSRELRPAIAIGITAILMILVSITFAARPHVIAFPLLIVWTALLFGAARQQRAPPFALLLLLVAWSNLHGGFTLGLAVALFAFFDYFERSRFRQPRVLVRWTAFAALCPLAAIIQPYGFQVVLATVTIATDNAYVAVISEWEPLNFREDKLFGTIILLLVLCLLVTPFRTSLSRGALSVLVLYMFLGYRRFIYAFGFVTPLILAADLADTFPSLSFRHWRAAPRDAVERSVSRHFGRYLGAVLVVVVATAAMLGFSGILPPPGFSAREAIAYARDNRLEGNVLNSYTLGGSLIFNGISTFIDGRSDQLFLGAFFETVRASREPGGEAALRQLLDEHRIEWAILTNVDTRIPYFEAMDGWSRAYSDPFVTIYAPVSGGSRGGSPGQ